MDGKVIVGVAAAAGLVLAGVAYHRRRVAMQAAATPPPAPEEVRVAPMAPPGVPPPQSGQLPKALGGAVATVVAGIKLQNAVGGVAEKVGGKGAGEVSRVVQTAAGVGIIIGKGAELGLERLGVDEESSRVGGIIAGTAAVVGLPVAVGVASLQLGGNLAQEALKLVAGEKVERAVSNAVSQADPFKTGSLANKAVAPVASAVSAAGKVLGGVFGGGGPSAAQVETARAQLAAEVQAGSVLGLRPVVAPPPAPAPVVSLPAVVMKPSVAPPSAAPPATKTITVGGRTFTVAA